MKALFTLLTVTLLTTNIFAQSYKSLDQAKGISVGLKAPFFTAMDADSNTFVLANELKNRPVVLIFYRGYWCPYCNRHLAQIQDSLKLITARGAAVVAISPEKPEYLVKMKEISGAKFNLLYDEDYKISDAYDLTFLSNKRKLTIYNKALKADLKNTHSDDSQRLPIPATYIISKDGLIVWRQFDPDYKNRSSVKDIINNLPL